MDDTGTGDRSGEASRFTGPAFQDRTFQVLLIASTLAFSWLGMMVVHEFGHVVFAWASGGKVARVVLSPLEFSRTDMQRNPHPLFVGWGGALVGTTLPLLISALWRGLRWPFWYVLQFFAGFCFIANGTYFGVVSFLPNAADPGDLMGEGCPRWIIALFGFIAFPLGLLLWNRLGIYFGLGESHGRVNHLAAMAVFIIVVVLIVVEVVTYAG